MKRGAFAKPLAFAFLFGAVSSAQVLAQTRPPVQITPIVPAGKTTEVGFFYAIDPDCSSRGASESRIIKASQNGNIEITPGDGFPQPVQSGPYKACNGTKVPGLQIKYTPNEGFTGKDQFDVEFFGPRGGNFIWKWYVTVK